MKRHIYIKPFLAVTVTETFLLAGSGEPPGFIPDPQAGPAKENSSAEDMAMDYVKSIRFHSVWEDPDAEE